MAGSMGLKVVAEGVETAEQLEFLREKRCDEVQGYLLSRPVPVPEATDFLRRGGDVRGVGSAQDLR
jgi:EAL domain-containing protein (putative c-di-GMP-specific phosphodiesterase class I)